MHQLVMKKVMKLNIFILTETRTELRWVFELNTIFDNPELVRHFWNEKFSYIYF